MEPGPDESKTCFRCKRVLPLTDFYEHPMMGDGRLGKCKPCTRTDVANGRKAQPAYYVWKDIVRRCYDPSRPEHKNYGGRGIGMCNRFRTAENFAEDVGLPPFPRMSIDRIDNDGGYWCGKCEECVALRRPMNVRWATQKQQANNTRRTIKLTIGGITLPLTEWCAKYGTNSRMVDGRIRKGWDPLRALTTKPIKSGKSGRRASF